MLQKINKAILLLTSNLIFFSQIVLTVWLPGSILVVFLRLYVFPAMFDELQANSIASLISNIIELALSPLYVSALLYALSKIEQGLTTNYQNSIDYAEKRVFKLLATRISTGLIVLLGLIAFIIPGIILSLRFALIDMVVVLEDVNGSNARQRSAELTKDKRWEIFGAIVIITVGTLLFNSILSSLLSLPLVLIQQSGNLIAVFTYINSTIYILISSIISVVSYIVLFLYYWETKKDITST